MLNYYNRRGTGDVEGKSYCLCLCSLWHFFLCTPSRHPWVWVCLESAAATKTETYDSQTGPSCNSDSGAELQRRFFEDFMPFLDIIDSYRATQDLWPYNRFFNYPFPFYNRFLVYPFPSIIDSLTIPSPL